ncbi:hypothetical protein C6P46_004019 [Rhodotorula mucilaginosa]|uniref:Sedlin n=1 Tax=Rhodotorula mucilaginosa TaxID=5537 RepID=A0A9P7B5X8_RHOMI|nr:hypothetical protein C6P46_004019 [Rhodotorula mucilaginosa]
MSYYLVLVGTLDNPLYEATLASSKATSSTPAASASTASPNLGVHSPAVPTSFSIFGAPQSGSTPNAAAVARGGAGGSGATIGYGQKTGPDGRHVMQLVAHASLDVVEDVQYLKSIDKFHEWTVSVWLTPGGALSLFAPELGFSPPDKVVDTGVKLILLHELKNDEGIRLFLQETWENYVKASPSLSGPAGRARTSADGQSAGTQTLLNPFHELNAPIRIRILEENLAGSSPTSRPRDRLSPPQPRRSLNMAGASTKRIAAANAQTLKQLRLGMAVSGGVYLLHLLIFSSGRSYRRLFLFAVTEAIAVGLWNQLQAMAQRGEELNGSKGLVSYMFDVLYVTWFVHVATALVSAKFWYLYWIIPLYALYRLASFALPYISPSLAAALRGSNGADAAGGGFAGQDGSNQPTSKRQEKLRKRMERGDPRVQQKEMRGTR